MVRYSLETLGKTLGKIAHFLTAREKNLFYLTKIFYLNVHENSRFLLSIPRNVRVVMVIFQYDIGYGTWSMLRG